MSAPWPGGLAQLAAACSEGTSTAGTEVAAALARIQQHDPGLHAFLETWPARAAAEAAALDALPATTRAALPLCGVPVALKDNLVRRGQIAAAGSLMLREFVSPYTATAVERLERAGAVPVGRTNMDEFGMGSTTEHSAFGPTRNPWDESRVPGGSSGGAAAAVADDLVPLALGSDTGGSIRQPAALCGVTGLKPTHGRISRHGLIAYASSLDCVGAIARSAADLALALDVLAGPCPHDATSRPEPVPDHRAAVAARTDLRGLTIGVPWELNGPGIDADVVAAVAAALDVLRGLGARTVDCALPHVPHAVPAYYLLATAEASTNLARYDGIRYGCRQDVAGRVDALYAASRAAGFGREVQLRILLGTFALRAGWQDEFWGQATRVRTLLRRDFTTALQGCDVLACPTSPAAAHPLGAQLDDPLALYVSDALTVPASLAGLPALSLPCGFTPGGLPVGLQLTGPALREDLLLAVAHVFQQHTDWHRRRARP